MNHKKKKIDFKYNLKVYFSLLGKYKLLFSSILLMVLISEAGKVIEKFLFKWIIDSGTDLNSGAIQLEAFSQVLILVAAIYISIRILSAIFEWLRHDAINNMDSSLMLDVKRKFFNHIVHLSHGFHNTHKTGSLISRLGRGQSGVERMTDFIVFNIAPLMFQLVLVAFSIVFVSRIMTLITVLTIFSVIAYSFIVQQMQRKANIKHNEAEDIEKANIADVFTNIDSIKYFGKESTIKGRFAKILDRTKAAALYNWGYFRWISFGESLIITIGSFTLFYVTLASFINKEINIGTVVLIYQLYFSLMGPMFGFIGGMRNFYRSMADFNDLFQYGKFENDIKDTPDAKVLDIKSGKVELRNISFSHQNRKIISNVSLVINPGEKIALVGHSGCGKTTLVKLLYRFYDLDSGSILIDGHDIRHFRQESLRSELSIVPQECILFDDTIYNNITFSKPHANRAEVFKAIKFAQLDQLINQLPSRENTIVGERGVRLSGGEKQRVSIARAILADKRVLVLDEATSSLDSKTEYSIQADLERLMENRTSIIIAHRLSTVMKADKIVVIEKGRIMQVGKHKDLIKKEGLYKNLWKLQKGGYLSKEKGD